MDAGLNTLAGRRILLVEDEYWIARELADALEERGAEVLGPIGAIDQAMEVFNSEDSIDGAILDINLRGERVFPLADLLIRRDVPVLFATGYGSDVVPFRLQHVPICTKPTPAAEVVRVVAEMLASSAAAMQSGD